MQKKKGPKKGTKYNTAKPFAFGQKLYEIRKKRGLTQTELAEKMGTSKRVISYFEREAPNPTIEVIEKAAQALGVPKKYFLADDVKLNIPENPTVIRPLKKVLPELSKLSRKEQESIAVMINSVIKGKIGS